MSPTKPRQTRHRHDIRPVSCSLPPTTSSSSYSTFYTFTCGRKREVRQRSPLTLKHENLLRRS
ncbi:hypothetical protein E2C01_044031 [Portunus trituberculatus]|uniref:Uncharacterized protein n=1 Tax=Portunus trituberculatus TaxID=210409 RepID=A0A5B7FZA9_PORTR|nr:hypothetical protein [Portunus trituberculatus]